MTKKTRLKVPDFSRNSCQFDFDRTLIGILRRMWIIVWQTVRIKADEHNILQEFQSEKQMTSPIEKCHIEKWVRQRALTMHNKSNMLRLLKSHCRESISAGKGQLIPKGLFDVIVLTKKPTKIF